MKSYYIKGDAKRGDEVIALLESKGGRNIYHQRGDSVGTIYFIDKHGWILGIKLDYKENEELLQNFCEELTLPEKKEWKPKFKIGDYFRDDDNHIGQIIGINNDYYDVNFIGYTPGGICQEDRMTPWEPKRGETVLVRNNKQQPWMEAIFSYYDKSELQRSHYSQRPFVMVGGSFWEYCIPFDINKLGEK